MNTKQSSDDFPGVQAAIYGMAISLDAFLLNGIQFGVLQRAGGNGFLQKTASNLLRDLASLEEHGRQAPATSQPRVDEVLAALRATCQQVIDLVTGLSSFRTFPLQQLRATVSQITLLRGECVQRIQELEACFQTSRPFYQSRPGHSTAAVNDFLANLQQLFAEEWAAANADRGENGAPTLS
jgi:hypothetical protein